MNQLLLLSRLTGELHLLSLADAGQLTLDRQPLCLVELLRERAAWLKLQADTSGVRITVADTPPSIVNGDALRLGQAFTIIMENALRYGRQGGHLNIGIRRCADVFSITFDDDGPGVDPAFLPIIFDRFTRADASRARHSGGSGLGLSIARAICLAHGGNIDAFLPEKGGLLIEITLPAEEI